MTTPAGFADFTWLQGPRLLRPK